jgi:hypothetical protein
MRKRLEGKYRMWSQFPIRREVRNKTKFGIKQLIDGQKNSEELRSNKLKGGKLDGKT